MAKRKKADQPASPPVAVPVPAPAPVKPPEGEYHTITSLAALCAVTEQTVRRWLWYATIKAPNRYGRLQWWTKEDAEEIASKYLQSGGFAINTQQPAAGGK